MKYLFCYLGILCIMVGASVNAFAQTFYPVADTFVFEDTPTDTYGSTSPLYAAYWGASGDLLANALIKFDLSSIPSNATVTGARMYIYVTAFHAIAPGYNMMVDIYETTSSWTEANTNWNNKPSYIDDRWDSFIIDAANTWWASDTEDELIPLVQSWVNQSHVNYGVTLTVGESAYNLYAYFSSREATNYRPHLDVTWTTPSVPQKATNPSPANGAIDVSINPSLSWSNGGGATSYNVYLGTNNPPTNIMNGTNQSGTTCNLGMLAYGTTYYWRIDSVNSAGTTTGDLWQFTTVPQPTVATPTFNPDAGPYTGTQNVTVSCSLADATIHYTTNGIDPTESDPTIASGGTVQVDHSFTLKAKAWKGGYLASDVKSATYTINPATATISGWISFCNMAGTALDGRKDIIPHEVTISIWEDEAYQAPTHHWPAILKNVYPKSNPNQLSEFQYSIDVTDLDLQPNIEYTIELSVFSGVDSKKLRFKMIDTPTGLVGDIPGDAFTNQVNFRLTYEDNRHPNRWVRGSRPRGFTYAIANNFTTQQRNAIQRAMNKWNDTGYTDINEWPWVLADVKIYFDKTCAQLHPKDLPHGLATPLGAGFWRVDFATDIAWSVQSYLGYTGVTWQNREAGTDEVLENVAMHEIGHVLGLKDVEDTSETRKWSIMTYGGAILWPGWADVVSLIKMNSILTITGYCPIDLEITDSFGKIVSKTVNQIPGATYTEEDIDGDGDIDDQINIPDPNTGGYSITVIPNPGANPADPVTLTIEDHGEITILLDEVPVADLPTEPIIQYVDRTPPQLVVSADPNVLRPANGQMEPITATVSAWDSDPNMSVALSSITSSELDDANYVTGADFGTLDQSFSLRASSSTTDPNGKTYIITYAATDSTGNVSYASVTVNVPGIGSPDLNKDKKVDLIDFSIFAEYWLGAGCTGPSWCSGADIDRSANVGIEDLAILMGHWLDEFANEPAGIVWVSINDSGAGMKDENGNPISHGGFTGQMSKYETTNAQYCQFLNAALASGDVTVNGSTVYGASGTNSGADFVGQIYYNLAGPGYTYDNATNGGAARIHYNGSSFTVDPGFENHPVTFVSWYGATAFCNYYGYGLPTEWEWQAVADFDGTFNYGCGVTISNSIANYYGSTHPDGTTAVGAFGTYGYGVCDLAGNVWEWTSSIYDGSNRVIRVGGWDSHDNYCTVSWRDWGSPDYSAASVCAAMLSQAVWSGSPSTTPAQE